MVGVTGGIAAYKTATLVRLLVKGGAEVRCVMTPMAKQFITPLTLATLSRNPISVEFFDPENGQWHSHVSLGTWADAFVVAPCTANTLAKMATGVADNLLLTTYLSARCPVLVAPAMDVDMYAHPATVSNLKTLVERGVHVVEPAEGPLASGLEGKGRMAEPEVIAAAVSDLLSEPGPLTGVRVMVTAGPTQEALDPVRYISNHSSGKMGYAVAEVMAERGATVDLVSGPVHVVTHSRRIQIYPVTTASEMLAASEQLFPKCQAAVMTAAVADYRPLSVSSEKIKRTGSEMTLALTSNPDIAATLGAAKRDDQTLVGFALETSHGIEHAQGKMAAKNLDMVVLNTLGEPGVGFGCDTNRVTILERDGGAQAFGIKSKREVAVDVVEALTDILRKKGVRFRV